MTDSKTVVEGDAVAFDAYRLVATVNGDVELVCVYCPDLPWRYEPRVTNLLEIVQTVRTHNGRCLDRLIQGAKASLRSSGNTTPTQWFIDNPSVYVQERLYLCRRTVWKGEWEQVVIA